MANRLTQEIKHFATHAPPGITGGPVQDSLNNWQLLIAGPKESPYSEGQFPMSIEFPGEFPFKPPVVKFMVKIYHPNCDEDGNICISILKTDAWKPSTRVLDIVKEIVLLLKNPNPDDPLDTTIAQQFKNDHEAFVRVAREWTLKHAAGK